MLSCLLSQGAYEAISVSFISCGKVLVVVMVVVNVRVWLKSEWVRGNGDNGNKVNKLCQTRLCHLLMMSRGSSGSDYYPKVTLCHSPRFLPNGYLHTLHKGFHWNGAIYPKWCFWFTEYLFDDGKEQLKRGEERKGNRQLITDSVVKRRIAASSIAQKKVHAVGKNGGTELINHSKQLYLQSVTWQ